MILIPLPLLDSTEHWNICMFSAQRERAKHPRCDICHRRICSNYSMSGAPSQPGVHSCTVRGAEPARGTQLSCEGCRPSQGYTSCQGCRASQGYTAVMSGVPTQPGVHSCHSRGTEPARGIQLSCQGCTLHRGTQLGCQRVSYRHGASTAVISGVLSSSLSRDEKSVVQLTQKVTTRLRVAQTLAMKVCYKYPQSLKCTQGFDSDI